jgi:hypothetical protein
MFSRLDFLEMSLHEMGHEFYDSRDKKEGI